MWDSHRRRRVEIAGASSAAREAWAVWRVVEGVSSKCLKSVSFHGAGYLVLQIQTLVLLRTFFNLGKSDIPASSIEIEESRRLSEERSEDTEEESEDMDCDCDDVM